MNSSRWPLCAREDCDRRAVVRGVCMRHYAAARQRATEHLRATNSEEYAKLFDLYLRAQPDPLSGKLPRFWWEWD